MGIKVSDNRLRILLTEIWNDAAEEESISGFEEFATAARTLLNRAISEGLTAEGDPDAHGSFFFDELPDPAGLVDREGRYITVNDAFLERHNMSREEVENKPILDLVLPDDRESTWEAFSRSRSEGRLEYFVNRHYVKDGPPIWLEFHSSTDEDSGITFFVARDITSRVEAERQFHDLFHLANDLVCIADADGSFIRVNPAFTNVLGHSEETLLSTPYFEFVHPDDQQATLEVTEQLKEGRDVINFRSRFRCADGTYRWLSWSTRLGESDHFFAIARDETERIERERDRDRAFHLLKEAQEIANVGDWLFDIQSESLTWSDETHRIFGVDLSDIDGRFENFLECIHPEDRDDLLAQRKKALSGDETIDCQYRVVHPGGDVRFVHERGRLAFDEETKDPLYLHGTVHDITELEEARRSLRHHLRRQELLTRYSSDLLGLQMIPDIIRLTTGTCREAFDAINRVAMWRMAKSTWTCAFVDGPHPDDDPDAERTVIETLWAQRQTADTDSKGKVPEVPAPARKGGKIFVPFTVPALERWCLVVSFTPNGRLERDADVIEFLLGVVNQSVTALENAHLQTQKREFSSRLYETQEAERRSIAKELHDEVGSILTGLTISLQITRNELEERFPDASFGAMLQEPLDTITKLSSEIRNLSLRLRPSMLDDFGLASAIPWLIKHYQTFSKTEIDLDHNLEQGARFPAPIETTVFRVTQESLTNIVRYAGAEQAAVRLDVDDKHVVIEIHDEGSGFDLSALNTSGATVGIPGMRERVELVGGQFMIDSKPGQGTRIRARLPVSIPEANRAESIS